jgi:hypothetical protein
VAWVVEFYPACGAWADRLDQADARRTEIRVLFAFDRQRKAILLVGGDKSGDWGGWYRRNVPIADDRFDEHQATLARPQRTKGKRKRS